MPVSELKKSNAVALGYFDGVHLGHRCILQATVDWAAAHGAGSRAFTFCFGASRTKGADILSFSERQRRILSCGVGAVHWEAFDAISGLSPQQFVQEILVGKLSAAAVFCGTNFRFGARAAGDVDTLRALCGPLGIEVHVIPLQTAGQETVSSTRIRSLLAAGDIPAANALLGEAYSIDFEVQHGRGLGNTMGYPTINQIYPAGMLTPPQGVYSTAAFIDGQWVPAATGFGSRPTVNGHTVTCESFLCRWQGDVYGSNVRVAFYEYLWPIKKYDSLAGLQQCISDAAAASCAYFDSNQGPGLRDQKNASVSPNPAP